MVDEIYDVANAYAAEAETQAKETVDSMSLEQLRAEYVALTAMNAYYTKMEVVRAQPRFHRDAIKEALVDIKADELLRQAEVAHEQGVEISGSARVPAKPLLSLLSILRQMVNPESDQ